MRENIHERRAHIKQLLDEGAPLDIKARTHEGDTMSTYPIAIAQYNNPTIQHEAEQIGATHLRVIGMGHSDGDSNNPNSRVFFLAIPDKDGDEWLVADTNGDPVWQEANLEAFRKLAKACSVKLY